MAFLCHTLHVCMQVLNTDATTEALLPYIKVFQSLIRWVLQHQTLISNRGRGWGWGRKHCCALHRADMNPW